MGGRGPKAPAQVGNLPDVYISLAQMLTTMARVSAHNNHEESVRGKGPGPRPLTGESWQIAPFLRSF